MSFKHSRIFLEHLPALTQVLSVSSAFQPTTSAAGRIVLTGHRLFASPEPLFASRSRSAMETKRQALGQIVFCNGCCCGRTDRGLPEVPVGASGDLAAGEAEPLNTAHRVRLPGAM